jgi:DNA polymerase III subunit gamma/tau
MTAREIINKLSDLNVRIWVDGEKVRWTGPPGIVTDQLLAEMREHKPEILALIAAKGIGKQEIVEVSISAPKIVKRGKGDFPHTYRPRRISEIYGQEQARKVIAYGLATGTLVHVLLFHGVSGTGKTTMGRIVAMGLNCQSGPTSEPCLECNSCKAVLSNNSLAYQELDAAHLSGVDAIRGLKGDFSALPLTGERSRIVLFDECHQLSEHAQAALLKQTEDVPGHLYFIFCSTARFLETLQNRCQQFRFNALSDDAMRALLTGVCASEGLNPDPGQLEEILKEAKGMPRNALLELQKIPALGVIGPPTAKASNDT